MPGGLDGPVGKRVYATFESHEALFIWLRHEADKRGYARKPTMFLADGCDAIWRLQEKYFTEAEVCLDWYHVVEKLWSAGECLHADLLLRGMFERRKCFLIVRRHCGGFAGSLHVSRQIERRPVGGPWA